MQNQVKTLDEEIFIIDSNYLDDVREKLYGYVFQNNKFLLSADELNIEKIPLDGNGTYVYIKREDNKIKIYQDYNGSYGLYLYRENDYFAMSNSFMRLVDYLKKDHKISFNKEYADALLGENTCPRIYRETLINEITCVDRNQFLTININSKEITSRYIDYKERSIELTTKEGMEILDKWYLKYMNLIRDLYKNGANIQLDLSGGFDTRMVLALFLGANIDLNNVFIFSENSQVYTYPEDYKIALKMAGHFKFKLNNKDALNINICNYSLPNAFNINYSFMMGFHQATVHIASKKSPYIYVFKGLGGERIRSYWRFSKKKQIDLEIRKCLKKYNDETIAQGLKNILERTYQAIENKYKDLNINTDEETICENIYKETYCKYHIGKWSIMHYMAGDILPNPLMDVELAKLKLGNKECDDLNLLMAIIFTRYVKDLLYFNFNGKQFIESSTIEYAKQINEKYPFNKPEFEYLTRNNTKTPETINWQENQCTIDEIKEKLNKCFYSSKLKHNLGIYYSPCVYEAISSQVNKRTIRFVNRAVAVGKIIEDVLANETIRNNTGYDFVENELLYFSDKNRVLPKKNKIPSKTTNKHSKKLLFPERVFSVKNQCKKGVKRKIIRVLGIKISIKQKTT